MMAVVMIAVSLIPGCKGDEKQVSQTPKFKVMELKGTRVPVFLQMVGQAQGIPTVEIRARVEGFLENWSFREGSIVNKGQVLFSIEESEYINKVNFQKADLENKIAAYEYAKLNSARLKPLVATKAISQNDYDIAVTQEKQAEAAVASGKANLEQAKLDLSYTTITSPITGYIGSVQVRPGNLVGRGESTLLATVSAVDPIYVDFQMNETDYLKIMRYWDKHKDEFKDKKDVFKVYLTLSDDRLYEHTGRIDFIDRAINPSTGTIALRAVFENASGIVKPGNFANVNLVLFEDEQGIVVPQSATTQIQGRNFAFLVGSDNKVNRVPIILGRSVGNMFIINDGLKIGDRIMLEGFQKFQEGMIIEPEMVPDTLTVPLEPGK